MRRFSQVFLKNYHIAQKICCCFEEISGNNDIMEIGPGKGILTQFLYPRYQKLYTGVEIDLEMVKILVEKFEGIKIINSDFLKLNTSEIKQSYFCGNLPYHISTAILEKIMELENFKAAVFMFQKEVAKKIVSSYKDTEYGYLSALINIKAETQYLFDVSRHNFNPIPEVDSAVVLIKCKKEKIPPEVFKTYRKFISAAFSYRRKTIANSLSLSFSKSKNEIEDILSKSGIKPTLRAEELPPDKLLQLSYLFKEIIESKNK